MSQNEYIEEYNQRIAFYGFANQATIVSPLDYIHTFYLSEEKRIILRSYDTESFSYAVCIDEKTEKAVAVQVLFDDEFLYAANAEDKKLILSICKAMMDAFCEVSTDKQESITKILFTSNGDLNDDVRFFDTDFVFESGYEGNSPVRSATSFSITTVSQDDFNSDFYWTPHNNLEYFIQAGDIAMRDNDFDAAIFFYEQSHEISNLEQAYRAKADYLHEQGDIEGAKKVLIDAGLEGNTDQMGINDSEYLLHREIHYDKNSELSMIIEHTYNDDGRKLRSTYSYYYSKSIADLQKSYGMSSDPDSYSVTYEYNDIGQVIIERVHGKAGLGKEMGGYRLQKYNDVGKLILRQNYDEAGAIENYTIYDYDVVGNMIRELQFTNTNSLYKLIEYKYDANGNKTSYLSPSTSDKWSAYFTYELDNNGNTVKTTGFHNDGSMFQMIVSEFNLDGMEINRTIYNNSASDYLELDSWIDYEYISIEDIKTNPSYSNGSSALDSSSSTDSFSIIGEWKAVYWIDFTTMTEKGIDPYKRIPTDYLIPETADIRLIINDYSLETINSIGRIKTSDWKWHDKTTIVRSNLSEDDEEESFTVIDSDTIHSGGGDGILVFQRIPMNH